MRDQHRPKQDLINEVVALRKQVSDLKEATSARRRVEDALRHSEEQLRMLVDCCPVGLCLSRTDAVPISANGPLARMLGYESPAELLSMSQVLGLFAGATEQARMVALFERKEARAGEVLLRRKDGRPHAASLVGAMCPSRNVIALVFQEARGPSPPGSAGALIDAWPAGIRTE